MTTQKASESGRAPKEIQTILLSGRIGIIASDIAERLDIDGMRALELFYESKTSERLHNEATGLYLMSDLYIVDEFMNEMQGK